MQIYAEASLADVKLSNLKLENVKVTDLSSNQKLCAQCLQPFDEGDEVLVIFSSVIKTGDKICVPLEEPYLIHATPKNNKYCIEDFVARLITPLEGLQKQGIIAEK